MARRETAALRASRTLSTLALVICLVIGVAALRAVWVQGIDAQGAKAAALARLKNKPQTLTAMRGSITDRNGQVLAETLPYVRIIADPYGIATNGIARDPKKTPEQQLTPTQLAKANQAPTALADILMTTLGGSEDDYLGHLTNQYRTGGKPNQYEPVAANVPAYTWAKIVAAMNDGGWYGLSSESTPLRIYPDGYLASNLLGFVGTDGHGLAGFEAYANSTLRGTDGTSSYERGAYGRIPLGDTTLVPAVNGTAYRLTIDSAIQLAAQQELQQAVSMFRADYGIALVMNVKTGEILAMADSPTFDNNNFGTANQADTGNRAVQSLYDPGSVQKILTVAALVDQGIITPDSQVVVPPSIQSGGNLITDAETHGTEYLTARGVIAYSSNIGAAILSRQSDKAKLVEYLNNFGLGQPTGIQLPGEPKTNVSPNMPDYQRDRVAFGESISVTAVQEAAAVAAVVNGGVYHQPTIVAGATDAFGNAVPQPALASRRVVSPQTSASVVNMMQAVTQSSIYGTSRLLPGYDWMGKTGTAQHYDPATGVYRGTTAAFVGVAPAEDPTYLVYVVVDNPAGGGFGATVAFPAARNIMKVTLPHFGVKPTGNNPYDYPVNFQP